MSDANPYTAFFNDEDQAKDYALEPPKFVPGFFDVHRMACVLMQERMSSPEPHILVHGAGGGLELESFARFAPNWTFMGVDPAAPMLEQARKRVGPFGKRISLVEGYIEDVPETQFDAVTSMLTLHFLEAKARERTVSEIVRRLKPGAPFITLHCSFPQDDKEMWLRRHCDYTLAAGVDPELAKAGRINIEQTLPVLNPEEDEAILKAAGLKNVTCFYKAFTWRAWVGYA